MESDEQKKKKKQAMRWVSRKEFVEFLGEKNNENYCWVTEDSETSSQPGWGLHFKSPKSQHLSIESMSIELGSSYIKWVSAVQVERERRSS